MGVSRKTAREPVGRRTVFGATVLALGLLIALAVAIATLSTGDGQHPHNTRLAYRRTGRQSGPFNVANGSLARLFSGLVSRHQMSYGSRNAHPSSSRSGAIPAAGPTSAPKAAESPNSSMFHHKKGEKGQHRLLRTYYDRMDQGHRTKQNSGRASNGGASQKSFQPGRDLTKGIRDVEHGVNVRRLRAKVLTVPQALQL